MADPPNVVIFLGAGASHALNTTSPLDADLLDRAIRRLSRGKQDGIDWEDSSRKLLEFLETYFGGRYTQLWDVLLLLDSGIPENPGERKHLRQIVESQICGVVADVMMGEQPGMFHSMAERMMSQLRSKWTGSRVDFITTNYDLVIDGSVAQHFNGWNLTGGGLPVGRKQLYDLPPMKHVWSMGTPIRKDGTLDPSQPPVCCKAEIPDPPAGAAGRPARIIKIHGSVNWVFCPKCDEVYLFNSRDMLREISYPPGDMELFCPDCGSRKQNSQLERMLVTPPEVQQDGFGGISPRRQGIFRGLWTTAETLVREAEVLFFIGYSLPPEDRYIRQWLAKANAIGRRCCKVEIIGRGDSPEIQSRYATLFGRDFRYHGGGLIRMIEEGFFEKDDCVIRIKNPK